MRDSQYKVSKPYPEPAGLVKLREKLADIKPLVLKHNCSTLYHMAKVIQNQIDTGQY